MIKISHSEATQSEGGATENNRRAPDSIQRQGVQKLTPKLPVHAENASLVG